MEKRIQKVLVFALLAFSLFALPGVFAADDFDHVITNSDNWEDVYSAIHYANLNSVGSDFLASPNHGPLLWRGIDKDRDIRVVSSRTRGYAINYDNQLRSEGFSDADELVVDSANLELILESELDEIENFIIVGSDYGYNAIAVAPYAVLTRSWVFIVDNANVDDVDAILENRNVDSLMIYGFVERGVRDTLEKYNPEIIDNGDRFKDNTEIVDRYLEIQDVTQVVLSNGEFIEKEIMAGAEPVLFTGKENVPDQIADYIKRSDIEIGVLIGADLVGAATNIRRSTGISVIVKFARGARNPSGAIAAVEGLDLFYLPTPIMQLTIHSAKFNRATGQLEITYRSESNIPVFFRGTITPKANGQTLPRLGDVDPVFIAPGDFKTVAYPDVEFTGDELSIDIFTLYGDTPSSLEKILQTTLGVEMVNVIDRCQINIVGAKYSKAKDAFIVEVDNFGDVDCWVDVELGDVVVDGSEVTIGGEGSVKVPAGKSKKIEIDFEMADEDLEDNSLVSVIVYYGEREDSLIKILQGRFELGIELISAAAIGLISLGLIVLIAIFILFFIWRRRRKKEEDYF